MSVQTYRIGPQNQIIDLNGSSVNFDINFAVKSKSGKNFKAVVVDQQELDSGKKIEYRTSENGEISANLISDKNVYKSYNLVLQSDEPQDVEVVIDKKIISPNIPPPPQKVVKPPPKKNWMNWKMVALVTVIIIGIGLLVYFYFKGDNKKVEVKSDVEIPSAPVELDVSSPLSTYSDKSSLSKALDDISPSP